jgi:hypothetical protein
LDVLQYYDRAVESGRRHGFIHIEALASERAAYCCLERGNRRIAQAYLLDAIGAYTRWGATAKVRQIEHEAERRDILLPISNRGTETLSQFRQPPPVALDLGAVQKASSALSEELDLEGLLAKLMSVALEIAHAERGVIVLILEPISKSSEEDNKARELYEAEKVLGVFCGRGAIGGRLGKWGRL